MSKAKKSKGFQLEKSLKKLEEIAEQLECGNSTLEESLEQFSLGINLLRDCRLDLDQKQQRVHILTNSYAIDVNQKDELVPFKINEE